MAFCYSSKNWVYQGKQLSQLFLFIVFKFKQNLSIISKSLTNSLSKTGKILDNFFMKMVRGRVRVQDHCPLLGSKGKSLHLEWCQLLHSLPLMDKILELTNSVAAKAVYRFWESRAGGIVVPVSVDETFTSHVETLLLAQPPYLWNILKFQAMSCHILNTDSANYPL